MQMILFVYSIAFTKSQGLHLYIQAMSTIFVYDKFIKSDIITIRYCKITHRFFLYIYYIPFMFGLFKSLQQVI